VLLNMILLATGLYLCAASLRTIRHSTPRNSWRLCTALLVIGVGSIFQQLLAERQWLPLAIGGLGAFLLLVTIERDSTGKTAHSPLRSLVVLAIGTWLMEVIHGRISLFAIVGLAHFVLILHLFADRGAHARLKADGLGAVASSIVGICLIVGVVGRNATVQCRNDKCSFAHILIRGGFQSENEFGIVCAIALTLSLAGRWRAGSMRSDRVLAVLLLLLVGSGSRTALVSTVAGLVAAFGISKMSSYRGTERLDGIHASSVGYLGIVFMVARLMAQRVGSESLSGRGKYWIAGLAGPGWMRPLGRGLQGWRDIELAHGFIHFPHSQLILLVVTSGLIGMSMFMLFFYTAFHSIRERSVIDLLPLTTLVTLCLTETIWNPVSVSWGTWIFVSIALFAGGEEGAGKLSHVALRQPSALAIEVGQKVVGG
jgi:hypothetical protein